MPIRIHRPHIIGNIFSNNWRFTLKSQNYIEFRARTQSYICFIGYSFFLCAFRSSKRCHVSFAACTLCVRHHISKVFRSSHLYTHRSRGPIMLPHSETSSLTGRAAIDRSAANNAYQQQEKKDVSALARTHLCEEYTISRHWDLSDRKSVIAWDFYSHGCTL